uniref:Uncharacterized protein n=1 Tax=Romanomermis culicivorax TaxID=13658 RepID=A0A915I117_ROMCU
KSRLFLYIFAKSFCGPLEFSASVNLKFNAHCSRRHVRRGYGFVVSFELSRSLMIFCVTLKNARK